MMVPQTSGTYQSLCFWYRQNFFIFFFVFPTRSHSARTSSLQVLSPCSCRIQSVVIKSRCNDFLLQLKALHAIPHLICGTKEALVTSNVDTIGQRYRSNSLFLVQTKLFIFFFIFPTSSHSARTSSLQALSPCSCHMQKDIVFSAKSSETVYANTVYN